MRAELDVLYKAAKNWAKKSGYPDHQEDFAQWLMIKYLEGKSQHQRMRDSFTDYLRETLGDTRKENFVYFRNFISLQDQDYRLGTSGAEEQMVYGREIITLLLTVLKDQEREVFTLYYTQNLDQKAVGARLNITESRVSQILTEVKKKLSKILEDDNGSLTRPNRKHNKKY